jgi:hypothetical protein
VYAPTWHRIGANSSGNRPEADGSHTVCYTFGLLVDLPGGAVVEHQRLNEVPPKVGLGRRPVGCEANLGCFAYNSSGFAYYPRLSNPISYWRFYWVRPPLLAIFGERAVSFRLDHLGFRRLFASEVGASPPPYRTARMR